MNIKRLALAVIVLSVTACGDSPVGPVIGQGGVTPQETTPKLSNVNGSLRGMYFSSGQNGDGDWLNLETGESGSMFSGKPRNLEAIVPAPYGSEYLESYGYKIVIKNWQTGLIVDEFKVPGEITGVAAGITFSPDGQTIGLFRDEFDTFDYTLAFFRRNGELIAEFAEPTVASYAWLPDGRFVFYRNGSLRVASLAQDDIRSRPLVSLQGISGSARNIKVSPDGQYLVFEMVTGRPHFLSGSSYRDASVYRVKIDGTELSQVATMENTTGLSTDEPRVNNPVWSLDGQFLMMSVGVSSSAVIFWDTSYSAATNDYEPLSISEVIVASSPGFMYVLPSYATDVVFLDGQSFPAVAHNDGGTPKPYRISSLHIEPGAVLVDAVERLPETIVPPSAQTGSLIYLETSDYDDRFTVMEYDARAGQERILFQVEGRDYDDAKAFGISSNKQLFAMWDDENYDEMYLRIFDSTGTQREFFQMVYYDGGTAGRRMLSAPQFSPVNDDLLLYRYVDEDTGVHGFGVLDWTTGRYVIRQDDTYQSVTWGPDGSIVLSQDNNVYRIGYANNRFNDDRQLLFTTINPAYSLDVNKQGTRMVFTMAGHVFHASLDGTEAAQVTAPSIGYVANPGWSPDGRHITLTKNGWRYIVSADSRYLQIYPAVKTNTNRHTFVTGGVTQRTYWLP